MLISLDFPLKFSITFLSLLKKRNEAHRENKSKYLITCILFYQFEKIGDLLAFVLISIIVNCHNK
jgi:hypothetical protein